MIGPPVYIFTAASDPGCFGLTLLRDGSNLPPPEGRRPWALFLQATLSSGFSWPTLPLDTNKFDEQGICLPGDFRGLSSYREFFRLLETKAGEALRELRSINPNTRDRQPETIDDDG
jgi:hypothetical protein